MPSRGDPYDRFMTPSSAYGSEGTPYCDKRRHEEKQQDRRHLHWHHSQEAEGRLHGLGLRIQVLRSRG